MVDFLVFFQYRLDTSFSEATSPLDQGVRTSYDASKSSDDLSLNKKSMEMDGSSYSPSSHEKQNINRIDDVVCSSLDNEPLPPAPSFILAGAQKAGTSALYFLLEKLPDVNPSLAFETHFFDQRGNLTRKASEMSDEEVCTARRNYLIFWENNGTFPEGHLAFEKTPIYLCKPKIPALIKKIVPWAHVIVMLRNPIDRAYSGYKMMRERVTNETDVPSFEELVNRNIKMLRDYKQSTAPFLTKRFSSARANPDHFLLRNKPKPSNWIFDRILTRGMYARQLVNWLEHFSLNVDIKIIQYELFLDNPSKILNEILEFVGGKPHHLSDDVLQSTYRPMRGVKRNFSEPMSTRTREYLRLFYEPYNRELAEMLGEEWNGAWND